MVVVGSNCDQFYVESDVFKTSTAVVASWFGINERSS